VREIVRERARKTARRICSRVRRALSGRVSAGTPLLAVGADADEKTMPAL
jgi:hypothetical protein